MYFSNCFIFIIIIDSLNNIKYHNMKEINVLDKKFKISISSNDIQKAITAMAEKINTDYKDDIPLFVAVLNGSFMFASDLLKKIQFDCNITFIKLSSYQGTQSSQHVQTLIGLNESIKGKRIILLEDIIDTGITLHNLLEQIKVYEPADIRIATLLFKPKAFIKDFKIDYVGMEIPNDFIVGFGLDYNGFARNYPDIYKISE